MLEAIGNALRIPELRRKILFTLGLFVVFRILANIAVPGANKQQLDLLFHNNAFLGLLDLFSGGGLSRFSIIAMGVNPYINASIIMQLMTVVSTRIKELQREGELGRRKITRWTRWLTVGLGLLQAWGLTLLFSRQGVLGSSIGWFTTLTIMVTLTAGTVVLMWFGELITEYGIGNGISLVIFAGIVGRIPNNIYSLLTGGGTNNLAPLLLFAVLAIVVTAFIIEVQQAQRKIPIQSAQRVVGRKVYQGRSSHLPLRVNQAGVIPIIFAISIMFFPVIIGNFLANSPKPWSDISLLLRTYWVPNGPNIPSDILYNLVYFMLIFGFTYFYTAVTFDPVDTADYLKKHAAFIPGIRPGVATAQYLDRTMTRITFAGALFLGSITVLVPLLATALTRLPSQNLYLGGTAVLIVVGVALDTMKQIETQLIMRQYKGFIK
ncbi:MAG: preprotein translocase subunit SecY [Chloroflexi bacterium]|nr:MAG: preprotein translocase subunit SecY [Chloroflexota bacterium]